MTFVNLGQSTSLLLGWRCTAVLELGDCVGAFFTLESSAWFAPPISSADVDLETLDMELRARLETLGLPVSLEAELVNAVFAP